MKHLPNLLSGSRILAAIAIPITGITGHWKVVFWLYLIGVLTDLIDGPLARHLKATSQAGDKLDKLGDGSLLMSTYLTLVLSRQIPWWTLPLMLLTAVLTLLIPRLHIKRLRRQNRSQEAQEVGAASYQAGSAGIVVAFFVVGSSILTLAYGPHRWFPLLGAIMLTSLAIWRRNRIFTRHPEGS